MCCKSIFKNECCLQYLKHGNEIDVVAVNHFVDEFRQFFDKALVLLQPRGMEMKTQRSPVSFEMTVEVVSQQASELFRSLNVGTRGDQVTTGQTFVEIGVVSAIQFVDDHFPNGVASGGASLCVTVAFVGHAVVQGVGPDGNTAKWSGDGGIVNEELIGHHFELLVAADAQVGSTNANDGTVGDVGEPLDDQTITGHFGQPVVVGTLGPVFRVVPVGNGKDTNFMASAVKLLNSGIIGVFVRNVEGSFEATAIGILPFAIENLLEKVNVIRVDGTVEGNGDHLWNLSRVNVAGNTGAVR